MLKHFSYDFIKHILFELNPLNTNPTEWSNKLKQLVSFSRRIT